MLAEGERQDDIEILAIDENLGVVTLSYAGTKTSVNFKDNAAATIAQPTPPPGAPGGPGGPGMPGAPGMPSPNGNAAGQVPPGLAPGAHLPIVNPARPTRRNEPGAPGAALFWRMGRIAASV